MDWEEFNAQDQDHRRLVQDSCQQNAVDWRARALIAESRAADLTDADRTALATAVRELKERRGTYETQLRRLQASGSDPAFIETWERAVARVNEAIEACERIGR
jgi:hypothetical protein